MYHLGFPVPFQPGRFNSMMNQTIRSRAIPHMVRAMLRRCFSSSLILIVYNRLPPSSCFFSSVRFMPRPLSSLQSTSNATGMPASSLLVPLTIDS